MLKECFDISVLLVSYNHEKYIRQALDALFGQKFDGAIELVVADDKSTDNTLSIIKEYEGVDSRFTFKYLDYSRNRGVTKNYKRGFNACTSEYVAVLEGDDYWINPKKLRLQRDFLDLHWECDLCSVNYFVFNEDCCHFSARTVVAAGHRFVGARDLIADNLVGNFSTCMYRKSALDKLPTTLYDIKSYDWIVNICIARRSLIGFLSEPMSVYRLHEGGVWTKTSPGEKLKEQFDVIPAYDALTEYVFHADFEALASDLRNRMARLKTSETAYDVIRPLTPLMRGVVDYLPPLLLILVRVLIPPRFKHLLLRILHRSVA